MSVVLVFFFALGLGVVHSCLIVVSLLLAWMCCAINSKSRERVRGKEREREETRTWNPHPKLRLVHLDNLFIGRLVASLERQFVYSNHCPLAFTALFHSIHSLDRVALFYWKPWNVWMRDGCAVETGVNTHTHTHTLLGCVSTWLADLHRAESLWPRWFALWIRPTISLSLSLLAVILIALT